MVFSVNEFWWWVLNGVMQGVVITFFTFFNMTNQGSTEVHGQMNGLWSCGIIIFTFLVVIANLKVYLFSFKIKRIILISVILSILFYVAVIMVPLCYMTDPPYVEENPYYGTLGRLWGNPVLWLGYILTFFLTVVLDVGYQRYQGKISSKSDSKLPKYRLPHECYPNQEPRGL